MSKSISELAQWELATDEEMAAAKSHPPACAPIDFSKEDVCDVGQHVMAFTQHDAKHPVLASFGAADCVIVAVYNPATKTAGLAHFDTLTDISSMWALLGNCRSERESDPLQVHLAGGIDSEGSKLLQRAIVKKLADAQNVEIVSADLGGGFDSSRKLMIDSRTGAATGDFDLAKLPLVPSDRTAIQLMMMQTQASGLKRGYDGRSQEATPPAAGARNMVQHVVTSRSQAPQER